MFVALKLIALAQSGHEVATANLTLQANIPNMVSRIPNEVEDVSNSRDIWISIKIFY